MNNSFTYFRSFSKTNPDMPCGIAASIGILAQTNHKQISHSNALNGESTHAEIQYFNIKTGDVTALKC